MPLFAEFGAAAQSGNCKQETLFDQEGGECGEAGRYTTAETPITSEERGQRAGMQEVFPGGEQERNWCSVFGSIGDLFDRERGRIEGDIRFIPDQCFFFPRVIA